MGLEYCRQLAALGCNILVVSNQRDALATLPQQLAADYDVEVWNLYANLVLPSAAQEVYDHCRDRSLAIDVLVNNAGMFFFHELDADTHGKALSMFALHADTPRAALRRGYEAPPQGIHSQHVVDYGSASHARHHHVFGHQGLPEELLEVDVLRAGPQRRRCHHRGARRHSHPLYQIKPRLMQLGTAVGLIRTPQWLVRRTLRGMLRRRHMVKPGTMNYIVPLLVKLLPNRLELSIWNRLRRSTAH